MSQTELEFFHQVIVAALPDAETKLSSGKLSQLLPPKVIGAAVLTLQSVLPPADVILAVGTDDQALVFELSISLGIPFVTAKKLDLVVSDDSDSSGFLTDQNLLQIQMAGETYAIARGAIAPQSRVLIFRDVLTDGVLTMGLLYLIDYSAAACVGVAAMIEKGYLGGRSRIAMHGVDLWVLVVLAKKRGQIMLEQRDLGLAILNRILL